MTLEDFGKLWIASSDLTFHPAQVRRLFAYGADTVVLKTALKNPPKQGKNLLVKNAVIIYHDFSAHPALFHLIGAVPHFFEDALEGGFLDGFKIREEMGSVSSYSEGGDPKLLSIEESNELYRIIKKEFPKRHVVQSLGITHEDDFELVKRLEGDAIELNLRYYHKFQRSPLLLPHNLELARHLGLEDEVALYNQNRTDVYDMTARYVASRVRYKPVLLKLERRADEMDYAAYADLAFDGFTCCDSGKNVIVNRDPRVGFRLINKGKTSGRYLLPSSLHVMQTVKTKKPHAYVSVSGGIVDRASVVAAFINGANSVQLCSALYLYHLPVVQDFALMLR